jgi:hypothetical protein
MDIDDALLTEAKVLARRTGKTLTAVVEDALRERFARKPAASRRERVTLPTFTGDGLQPGVNLDDSAGLRDLMDAAS